MNSQVLRTVQALHQEGPKRRPIRPRAQYAFTLEPYADGTPAPTVVTKEADMVLAAPFVFARPDFSKTEVVKAYAYNIVAPAMDYWKQTIEVKKGVQLA